MFEKLIDFLSFVNQADKFVLLAIILLFSRRFVHLFK